MTWVVDDLNIVHVKMCSVKIGNSTTYLTAPKTTEDLIEHLAEPDAQATLGSKHVHYGPSILIPCDYCILEQEIS